MAKTKNADANPLFRELVKSPEECFELFHRDKDRHLATAVGDVLKQMKQSGKTTLLDMKQAELACGGALWNAITQFNIFRRDRGVLGGLPVPDYEVLGVDEPPPMFDPESEYEESDDGDWVYGFENQHNMQDSYELAGEENTATEEADGKSAFAIAARLRRSRTQWGKIQVLAKEARAIAEKIEEFAQGFDYVQRTSVLARAVEGYDAADDAERPRLRTMLTEEVARVRNDRGMKEIQTLLERLATFRDPGGNPGHLFQRTFMQALIPHWVVWTGEKPRRENRAFIEFVQAAYFVVSAREFEGWANLMTTALEHYEKTSQQNS